jgi:tetratricopeptide (TPR) repeat protein
VTPVTKLCQTPRIIESSWTSARRLLTSVRQLTQIRDRQYARATGLHRAGRLQDAAAAYADVLRLDPAAARAWHLLGVVTCQQGKLREGVDLFRKAVEMQPGLVAAWMDLGAALRELRDPAGAVACFDRVIEIDPGDADAYNSRGEALSAQRLHDQALLSYRAAIRLNSKDPRMRNNAGAALLELGRLEDALGEFDHALSQKPGYVRAQSNRGSALYAMGRLAESIVEFNRALYIQPDYAEARFNRGMARLLLGQLTDGWRDYEARLQMTWAPDARNFAQPAWRGDSDLEGKRILLHAEQGLGDTLQFCRYATVVANLGARVILEVQRELACLLHPLEPRAQVVARGDPLPAFDLHCPLLSLPLALGTDLSTIPACEAYLRAQPEQVRRWQARLGPRTGRPRVGLAWSGGHLLKNDGNRNLPLRQLLGALDGIDVELISLQKDVRRSDAVALAECGSLRHFADGLQDFSDTAALASLLDVAVTVDTSVAHLCAAIGRPTWILLPRVPDWRWLLDRADSPWYPTVRLYRQKTRGDWAGALEALRSSLLGLGRE